MPKRIKNISELPNWYQFKKYDDAKKLNAIGWYEQLTVRQNCFSYIEMGLQKNKPSEKENPFIETLKFLRTNPIINTETNDLIAAYFYNGPLSELKPRTPHYSLGVHSLTLREFTALYENLLPERRDYLKKWQAWLSKIKLNEKPSFSYQPWIDQSLSHSSQPGKIISEPVYVDLDLPDSVLIQSFKQYLEIKRAQINIPTKRYHQPDFYDWWRFGILPYLDLKIWETLEDISIPNRVIAQVIYPPGEYGEETVRKTTAPLAEQLMTEQALNILAAQAAYEITEEKNRSNVPENIS